MRQGTGRAVVGASPLPCFVRLVTLVTAIAAITAAPTVYGSPPPEPDPRTTPLREQTVYVPYEHLEDVFEKEGRGVFLPYARFLELWSGAAGGGRGLTEQPPPAEVVIPRARYEAEAGDSVVVIDAELSVKVLRDGWTALPLRFGDASVTDVSVEGDGVLMGLVGGQLHVIASRPGDATLKLTLVSRLSSTAGRRTFSFAPPPVPAALFTLRVPEPDARLEVQPALPITTSAQGESTVATIAPGAASSFQISWRPRPRATTASRPLTFVTANMRLRVGAGVISAETVLDYRVLQAPLEQIRVALPAGSDLTAVDGVGIRDWRDEEVGGARVLTVELRDKVKGSYRLRLSLERPLGEDERLVEVPSFHDLDARRQQGHVAVVADAGLKMAVSAREGIHQIDASELPGDYHAPAPALAFRFLRLPWALRLTATPIEPRVRAEVRTLYTVEDEKLVVDSDIALHVQRAGIFRIDIDLPAGLTVRKVGDEGFIDDYDLVAGDVPSRQRLSVRLATKQLGHFSLPLRLERSRSADELEIALPLLHVRGAERERGVLGLAVRDRFRARTVTSEGVKPIDVNRLPSLGLGRRPSAENATTVMGFRYERPGAALVVSLEQRDAKVVATVETRVGVEEDVVKVKAIVQYTVRYAGVDQVAFTLPTALDEVVRIEGELVKERLQTRDAGTGLTTWRVTLQRETEGVVRLDVSYEHALSGEQPKVTLSELVPLGVDRDSGHFAVVKAGNIEIRIDESAGLEPIDAKELPSGLREAGVFQALKYLAHPYALSLKVTKHAYEPVLQAIAEVALLETVVSEEGVARTEMALLMQSNQRQYLELRLPEGSEILTAFVDGEMVRPARREDGTLLLKMPQDAAGGSRRFVTRVVYQTGGQGREQSEADTMGGWGTLALEAPKLGGVPVSLLLWRIWLPNGYRYLAPGGTMHEVIGKTGGWPDNKQQLVALVPGAAREAAARLVEVQGFVDNEADIRATEGEKASGPLPIQVRLVRQGTARDFVKLDGAGAVSFCFIDAGVFVGLELVLFLLAFGIALLLGRIVALRGRKWAIVVVLAGVPVLVASFVSLAAAGLLNAICLGALAAAVLWAVLEAVRRARVRFGGHATTGEEQSDAA